MNARRQAGPPGDPRAVPKITRRDLRPPTAEDDLLPEPQTVTQPQYRIRRHRLLLASIAVVGVFVAIYCVFWAKMR
jgi:hypothetical protein